MNKLLIAFALLGVLFLSGCEFWDDNFIWDKDLPQHYEEIEEEFHRCVGKGGHYWSNEEQTCKQMEETKGCITLKAHERIETTGLPIGYKNITESLYDDGDDDLEIIIWCSGELRKPINKTCEQYVSQINNEFGYNYIEGISYYRFTGGHHLEEKNKTIELCWE